MGGKPRTRGDDPKVLDLLTALVRVNPARAGMIPSTPAPLSASARKPRTRGDDPN